MCAYVFAYLPDIFSAGTYWTQKCEVCCWTWHQYMPTSYTCFSLDSLKVSSKRPNFQISDLIAEMQWRRDCQLQKIFQLMFYRCQVITFFNGVAAVAFSSDVANSLAAFPLRVIEQPKSNTNRRKHFGRKCTTVAVRITQLNSRSKLKHPIWPFSSSCIRCVLFYFVATKIYLLPLI